MTKLYIDSLHLLNFHYGESRLVGPSGRKIFIYRAENFHKRIYLSSIHDYWGTFLRQRARLVAWVHLAITTGSSNRWGGHHRT